MSEIVKSMLLSFVSGIAGSVLTLVVTCLINAWRHHHEFGLLKRGLYVELTTAIDEIYAVVPTYAELYEQNEYRLDDSMLLSAKEKLVKDFDDVQLLGRVSKALSSVRALNRLLDHYKEECLRCSEKETAFVTCQPYIARLNHAVGGAFKQTISAMSDLGSYVAPAEYAKRIAKIEKQQRRQEGKTPFVE